MRRKIAAILAADIAGYSRLVAEDEEETVRRLGAYRGVFDDLIARYGGRIFNTAGDAVLAEFTSSVEAVRCAVDVQESLRTRNRAYPPSRTMSYRIGITVGDVIEREGDLLGDGVNIAARLEALAPAGGICISNSVFEQVANKVSVRFADLGEQAVKNIPRPVRAYVIAQDDVTVDASRPQPAGGATYLSRRNWLVAVGGGLALLLGVIWLFRPDPVRVSPVMSTATPVAAIEGAFEGTMHCDKLPWTSGRLEVAVSLSIKRDKASFSRDVYSSDGKRKVGVEVGEGKLDGSVLQLATSWISPTGRFDGNYSGLMSAAGGSLSGKQILLVDGARHDRPCTVVLRKVGAG